MAEIRVLDPAHVGCCRRRPGDLNDRVGVVAAQWFARQGSRVERTTPSYVDDATDEHARSHDDDDIDDGFDRLDVIANDDDAS